MASLKQHIKIAKRNTKITPTLHGWLNNNSDGIKIEDPAIAQRVLEILAPSDGDRSGAFHPSQLYQCKRAQIFGYYGIDTQRSYNPVLQNLFNDGHFRHLRWQIMLLNAGVLTDIEVKVSIPELRLTGSMDGANMDKGWMFELKGTSAYSQVMQRGAMPDHIKQINAYLMASKLDSALLVYECKSSQNWLEIEVQKDPTVIMEIESILKDLNQAIDTGKMPEVLHDCQNQTGARFNKCPYNNICLGVRSTIDIHQIISPKPRVTVTRGNETRNRPVRRRPTRA